MSAEPAPTVVVIDDEEGVRELLKVGLHQDGFVVHAVADGSAGLEAIRRHQPDCIVLDVMLPQIDGYTLVAMIRRITQAPIIMLTALGEVRDRIDGLRSGADDFMHKPFELEELALRIRAAIRRPALRDVEHVVFDDLTIDVRAHTVARAGTTLKLSSREFDLLLALVKRPRRVFTRDELLDLVWGNERLTSPQTVETFISSLRHKVDAGFPTTLIHTVRGVGYTVRLG
jgi:DNA-binding response OmpR family regulator